MMYVRILPFGCSQCSSHSVLVAHNGYKFDFPMLLAELERRSTDLKSHIQSCNIHFADTLPHLRQSRKDGFQTLSNVKKFGVENLFQHFFPDKQFTGKLDYHNNAATLTNTQLKQLTEQCLMLKHWSRYLQPRRSRPYLMAFAHDLQRSRSSFGKHNRPSIGAARPSCHSWASESPPHRQRGSIRFTCITVSWLRYVGGTKTNNNL